MTVRASWVAVTTAPAVVVTGGSNGLHVKLYNAGGPTIYVGGSAVSGTTGFAVGSAAALLALELEAYEDLYAVAASGTATVQVLQGGA
jgi:hypothetical protein